MWEEKRHGNFNSNRINGCLKLSLANTYRRKHSLHNLILGLFENINGKIKLFTGLQSTYKNIHTFDLPWLIWSFSGFWESSCTRSSENRSFLSCTGCPNASPSLSNGEVITSSLESNGEFLTSRESSGTWAGWDCPKLAKGSCSSSCAWGRPKGSASESLIRTLNRTNNYKWKTNKWNHGWMGFDLISAN